MHLFSTTEAEPLPPICPRLSEVPPLARSGTCAVDPALRRRLATPQTPCSDELELVAYRTYSTKNLHTPQPYVWIIVFRRLTSMVAAIGFEPTVFWL